MDCKEFERLIPSFIEQKQDFQTIKKFLVHMDECPDCKEELVIQFLVTEGMQRLEEGDAFDLQNELEQQIIEAKKKLRFHNAFLRIGVVVEIIAMLLIAAGIIWIMV